MSQLAMSLPVHPTAPGYGKAPDVRRAERDDVLPLAALLGRAFPAEVWSEARVEAELTEAADVLKVFVAVQDDTVIGTASARRGTESFPGFGYVHWVAVDPAHRGQGHARALVERVVAALDEAELWPVVLETDDERHAAISSYLNLGFIPLYVDKSHEERWSLVFERMNKSRKIRGGR